MKAGWVSVVGHLIGQVLRECLGPLEHVRFDNYVQLCVYVREPLYVCLWLVYASLLKRGSQLQIAVSCLIVRVIMKYCLIYWMVETFVILMNRTFYFFIPFIV